MRESKALGLWTRHCWVMDQFYDDENLPEELKSISDNESDQDLINDVIGAAESDVEALLEAVQADIEKEFARKQSPFTVSRKRSADGWSSRMTLMPRRGQLAGGAIHLGTDVTTVKGSGLNFYLWLWAKGGRATEVAFIRHLHGATPGREDLGIGWDSGVALLSNIPLDGTDLLASDGLSIKLPALRAQVAGVLRSQTNDRLQALATALRNR